MARQYLHTSAREWLKLVLYCVEELFRNAGNLMRVVIPEPCLVTRVAKALHIGPAMARVFSLLGMTRVQCEYCSASLWLPWSRR